jgi:uncharacterized protein YcbX
MYKKHMHVLMMSALAAGFATGAVAAEPAAAPADPEFPNDGKFRVKHSDTGQVNVFETREQLATFGQNIADHADRDSWQLIRPTVLEDETAEQLTSDTAGAPVDLVANPEDGGATAIDASSATNPAA